MMASSSRILTNLTDNTSATIGKAATHPTSKQKHVASKKLGLTQSSVDNVPKRKTIGTFKPENLKTASLFSVPSISKPGTGGKENFKSKKKAGGKLSVHGNSKSTIYQDAQNDEAYNMIRDGQPTERYWELLAEERRKGLEVALKQNKKLHEEHETKDKVIAELRIEVEDLKESLEHAERVTTVVEQLLAEIDSENSQGKATVNHAASRELRHSSAERSNSDIAPARDDDCSASVASSQAGTCEADRTSTDVTLTASPAAGDNKQKDE